MTDKDIITALELCGKHGTYLCDDFCPMFYNGTTSIRECKAELLKKALDLINRQQAEIEKWRYNLEAVLNERADHSEAIKEFAERLKANRNKLFFSVTAFDKQIDNLVKEMVGDTE